MADIYRSSLHAKYESIMRVVASDLGFGDQLTALTIERLNIVHSAAEQAIFNWATRREAATQMPPPISNLQHLLDEYCAIADHI